MDMRQAWVCFVAAALVGCGSDGGRATVATDTGDTVADAIGDTAGVSDAIDPATVPLIGSVLPCGARAQAGGIPRGGDLARFDLDTAAFPDALCNDGTTPILFYRRYEGEQNANRWVIQLKGGGACTGAADCAKRWCSVLTNFGKTQMTGDVNDPPLETAGAFGILNRADHAAENPFAGYNQVFVNYCSSDTWSGEARDKVFNTFLPCEPGPGVTCPDGSACPADGDMAGLCADSPVRYRMHFLGRAIVDAVFATLRRDGVAGIGAGGEDLPDLDDADHVVFAGASGGGAGVIQNLDRVAALLREHNTHAGCTGGGACPLLVEGLIDSIVGPTYEGLDFSGTAVCLKRGACDYEHVYQLSALSGPTAVWNAEYEESCESWHAAHDPGSEWRCTDNDHVVRNHLTTPFFVRDGLVDSNIGGAAIALGLKRPGGAPIDDWLAYAALLQPQLEWFSEWATEAEEATAGTRPPGVFAPGCSKHETLSDDVATYDVTVRFQGAGRHFFDVWSFWQAEGALPAVLVADQPADSDCAGE